MRASDSVRGRTEAAIDGMDAMSASMTVLHVKPAHSGSSTPRVSALPTTQRRRVPQPQAATAAITSRGIGCAQEILVSSHKAVTEEHQSFC